MIIPQLRLICQRPKQPRSTRPEKEVFLMEKCCSRKIDEIGRLILPIELRAKMGLSNKEDKTKRFYATS